MELIILRNIYQDRPPLEGAKGQAQHGGWTVALYGAQRKNWVDSTQNGTKWKLTPEGKRTVQAYEGTPKPLKANGAKKH